jgi:hypothetical protein
MSDIEIWVRYEPLNDEQKRLKKVLRLLLSGTPFLEKSQLREWDSKLKRKAEDGKNSNFRNFSNPRQTP